MLLVANFANIKKTHGHSSVLSKTYPMNTKMTGLRCFFLNLCVLVLWMNVASALEGLKGQYDDGGKSYRLVISPCALRERINQYQCLVPQK